MQLHSFNTVATFLYFMTSLTFPVNACANRLPTDNPYNTYTWISKVKLVLSRFYFV